MPGTLRKAGPLGASTRCTQRPRLKRLHFGREALNDRPAKSEVALFVTCLADAIRPSTAFAAARLIEACGFRVHVPDAQTCCGQPAFNSGDTATARALAERFVEAFEPYAYVVAPSGSCMGMLKTHLPHLFADDPAWLERHAALAERCYELSSFLADVADFTPEGRYAGRVTYHHGCSALRELGVRTQPERLITALSGLSYMPLAHPEACCGFGGTFCVKYADISTAIADEKVDDILATGAKTLIGGDLGCLFNIQGRLHRRGADMEVLHLAELLAGSTDTRPAEASGS